MWESGLPAMQTPRCGSHTQVGLSQASPLSHKLAPALRLFIGWLDERNPHIFRRKTSNLSEHLVQSQPL